MTGINLLNAEVTGKRLELLREFFPRLVRIAVLVNPADQQTETQLKGVNVAAGNMGLQIQVFNANTSAEIDAAFETMGRERPDALLVGSTAFLNGRRVQLAHLATFHRLPAIYALREYPEAGG
jgi:putative tryptophan/tyrosine transport system substrate-binding protein